MLETSIRNNWERPALSNCDGETLLYKDVARYIGMLQRFFVRAGIGRGDKIAICSRNQARWGVAFMSVLSSGAVPVPILQDFRAGGIHYLVNHCDATILFAGATILETLNPSVMPNLKAIVRLEDFAVVFAAEEHLKEPLAEAADDDWFGPADLDFYIDSPDDLAIINYTSGTSGFAKGVMLPYRSLVKNVELMERTAPGLNCCSNVVSMLPTAHMYGLMMDLIFEMTVGAHVHFLMRPPSPIVIRETFSAIRPDIVMTVPLVVEKIVRRVIQTLDCPLDAGSLTPQMRKQACEMLTETFGGNFSEVVVGGAPLNREVEDFLLAIGFRYTVGSGMTECGPLVSLSQWDKTKPHTCGKRAFYNEIRIDSPDPEKIPGEVYIRGGNVFLGYYKMPRESAEVFSGEGWFRTGDIGTLDSEGFLSLKGRCKSMILTSAGQNIYPEEIESSINNLPYVQESLVVSVKNQLVALIYPDQEMVASDGMSEADVYQTLKSEIRALNGELPTYCAISRIEIFPEEFEKTPKNSIKRYLYDRETKTI
ncbi:MAG: AMP-binding protein [Bacteroidales bacterium]|nr:AMP-binding protein [Bacteroidales bacterium]